MMGYGYGMMGIGWFWMMFIPLILIGIIVYAAVRLANGKHRNYENKYDGTNHAMEILNQRFASGEINEEEYKRKKELLRK